MDAYHKVSLNNLLLKVHRAPLRSEVELRITLDEMEDMVEIRIWYQDELTDIYRVKSDDLNLVHF